MKKQYFYLLIITTILQGCTSLSDKSNIMGNISDYLTDIKNEESGTKTEDNPVVKSTHDILQAASVNQEVELQSEKKLSSEDAFLSDENASLLEKHYVNVWQRIPDMYQISHVDNKRIQRYEEWFLKHKKYLNDVSKRASSFLYFITEEVSKRNMPGEIALLPIIESSFKPHAYSRMKASGLWQFIPSTGKSFGLKQNWWYDGRRDVYHSTIAALTYLQQLNKYYKGDWLLALAAYNAGAGNVNKAIKKNLKKGKPVDYWSLPLPKETMNYVPKLLAIAKLVQNHETHKISLFPIENSPRLILVDTKSQIDLSIVAKMTDMSLKNIQAFNPAFSQWATDPEGPHQLFIPVDKVDRYEREIALISDEDRINWYRHKIRSGESLSVIARKYKISVSALKKTNHLSSSRIRAGKYLLVPVNGKKPALNKSSTIADNNMARSKVQIYKVRKGDSFWIIARRFGLPHKELAAINGLSAGDILSIGQKLKIPTTNSVQKKSDSLSKNRQIAISYKVKTGDSLYTISKQFQVSINELRVWNHAILKKYLMPGQDLTVYVDRST